MNSTKQQIMAEIAIAMQKKWGAQVVQRGDQLPTTSILPPLPTSFPRLDALLQGGMMPGQVAELCGVQTSGTSTLALKTTASAQAGGKNAIYIDSSYAFSPKYAYDCGVDLEKLLLVRPATGLEGMELAVDLLQGYAPDLLIFGHSPTLMGDGSGVALRRLLNAVKRSSCVFIVLNRAITPSTSPFHSHAATRLLLERVRWLQRWGVIGGYLVRVHIAKVNGTDCNRVVTLRFNLP